MERCEESGKTPMGLKFALAQESRVKHVRAATGTATCVRQVDA